MLYQILAILEQAEEPLSLDELSRRLHVEPGALNEMIAFWVRKGRLRDSAVVGCGEKAGCSCNANPQGCPFRHNGPRLITLCD
ncbi:FeoC-like transcriptional regulator [Chloroflexus sp.]|uniref:FeoC-like transcriptional regulator n=1 Tax=Chloroflexus sp. TaxID=1904827 RepID=UPI002635F41D|nr:FeoC-like transcriptional regulator [uncultured Chloroflexus sp.]